jgi:PhnB protein
MSDTMQANNTVKGNNIRLSLDLDDIKKMDDIFARLSAGGKILMPLGDQFWGARFGMLEDAFGIQWMLNCELNK